ncbi:MAG: hypothetical protein ABL882_01575 [Sphingopyxis sp.]
MFERLDQLFEAIFAVDDGVDFPRVNQSRDGGQLCAARFGEIAKITGARALGRSAHLAAHERHRLMHEPAEFQLIGHFGGRRPGNRHQRAAGFEHFERIQRAIPAKCIVNDVVACSAVAVIMLVIFDDYVRPQCAHHAGVARAGGRGHIHTDSLGILDRETAHAARPCVDQDGLPRRGPCTVRQPLHRGQRDQRQRSRFGVRQRCRFKRGAVCGDAERLGKTATMAQVGAKKHGVARLETRHPLTNAAHYAAAVETHRAGQFDLHHRFERAVDDLEIDGVECGGVDLDHYLAGTGGGVNRLDQRNIAAHCTVPRLNIMPHRHFSQALARQ